MKYRHFIIQIITFCFIVIPLHSQENDPINLAPTSINFTKVMAIEHPSTRQVDSLIQLSISYSYTNQDTCIILGDKSVEISRNHKDRAIHGKALLELGDTYRIFGNPGKGDSLIQLGKKIYLDLDNKEMVAYADNKLGALYQNLGQYEEALSYYTGALSAFESLKDTGSMINPCINIGLVLMHLKKYRKSESYNKKALEWTYIKNADRSRGYIFNNQAIIYKELYKLYLSKYEEATQDTLLFRDSANYFLKLSLTNFEDALAIAKKQNDKFSEIRNMVNITELKNTFGEYKEAISIGKETELLITELNSPVLLIIHKKAMSEAYRNLDNLKLSLNYALEAHDIANKQNMEQYLVETHKALYLTYQRMGILDKALFHLEALNLANVSDGISSKNKAIAEVEAKYQNQKKENQILEQKTAIMLLEQKNIKAQKQKNLIIGGGSLLALLSFLGFRLNKMKNERNDKRAFAEALIFAQEEERKRIAQDLHDGVGQSLLLIKKQLENNHEVTIENQNMISQTLEEVRSISQDLHPFQLEKFGLNSAILNVVQKVEALKNIFITKELDNIDGIFTPQQEINIYRTIQEAFNNIIKHSEATAARISIHKSMNNVEIKILDNGKGFDHELKVVNTKSLGLKTMNERIISIGGKFNILKGENGGTIIKISLPLNQK